MANNYIIVLILLFIDIKHTTSFNFYPTSFSYNPYCWVAECCNENDIPGDTVSKYGVEDFVIIIFNTQNISNSKNLYLALKQILPVELLSNLKRKVYGQHFVEMVVDAISAHWNPQFKPDKALTLSFHGWPGGGKNYVAKFIAESLFKQGMYSKFVHNFIGRVHFPEKQLSSRYREDLYSWLKYNISKCGKQLFIFDEVDKMPPTVLNAIKPMIDYRNNVDGVDYTRAIFIFLSNTGAGLINEHYHELWNMGKTREELKLNDFERMISKGAFNEEGGFQFSDTIKSNLIDHFIPFLPMQESHVRECIKDQFRERNVFSPSEKYIQEVMEFIEWGPYDTKLFSKTGCKRISSKVAILVAKHYWRFNDKSEL